MQGDGTLCLHKAATALLVHAAGAVASMYLLAHSASSGNMALVPGIAVAAPSSYMLTSSK